MKKDLDDAEGGIGVRLEVLDVVYGRRQRAFKRGDNAPGHLIGRHTLVLKGHAMIGMLMFGKISTGMRNAASVPISRMSNAATMNVYGRLSAIRTIASI